MLLPTLITFSDVAGKPCVRKDLPSPLRIGDKVRLEFRLSRTNSGRHEVLDVKGEFKVVSVSFDATASPRQLLLVESSGKEPTWRAIKKAAPTPRRMAPARFPPTEVT